MSSSMSSSKVWMCLGLIVLVGTASTASAGESKNASAGESWLAAVTRESGEVKGRELADAPAAGSSKPAFMKGLEFSLEYVLVSDYIWRGLNFSEYAGEGREKLNHQLSVTASVTPSEWCGPYVGTFSFNAWFEWYAGQERLTVGDSGNNQENDYTWSWAFDLSEVSGIPVTFETGWIHYTFPRLKYDAYDTNEWYVALSLDDGALLGVDGGIVNPSITYYQDLDDVQASFIMIGMSREFALATLGCANTPILKDVTVTPSVTFAIDHRYYDKFGVGSSTGRTSPGTRLGYIEWGLEVGLDLNGALGIPEQYGAFSLTGFLNFSDSCHDEDPTVKDEFYGGMKLGWSL